MGAHWLENAGAIWAVVLVGTFLVFEPKLLYFSRFFIPTGLNKKRKKLAINGVFLFYDKLLSFKPKVL
jgi:hypothetical protein